MASEMDIWNLMINYGIYFIMAIFFIGAGIVYWIYSNNLDICDQLKSQTGGITSGGEPFSNKCTICYNSTDVKMNNKIYWDRIDACKIYEVR